MKKHGILTLAALMALGPALMGCDDDQPQTPQQESSRSQDLNGTAPAAGDAMAGSAGGEGVAGDTADNAGNAAGENAGGDGGSGIAPDITAPPGDVSAMEEGMALNPSSADSAVDPQTIPESDIPPPPSRDVFTDRSCDFEAWVGQPLDEAAISATGRPVRVMTPGDKMTMDHNPDRINVEHENGKVTRVWCG